MLRQGLYMRIVTLDKYRFWPPAYGRWSRVAKIFWYAENDGGD